MRKNKQNKKRKKKKKNKQKTKKQRMVTTQLSSKYLFSLKTQISNLVRKTPSWNNKFSRYAQNRKVGKANNIKDNNNNNNNNKNNSMTCI